MDSALRVRIATRSLVLAMSTLERAWRARDLVRSERESETGPVPRGTGAVNVGAIRLMSTEGCIDWRCVREHGAGRCRKTACASEISSGSGPGPIEDT